MPNLLAHYGAQTAATGALLSERDLKWILLGCLLPDVPWILQRALWTLAPGLDPFAVRLYAVAQASLLCTLLLAGGLSLLSDRPARVFAILSVNAALALLLDGLQTKWGSGVHFLAPVDWSAWSADLFFPESAVTYSLTAFGLILVPVLLWTDAGEGISVAPGDRRQGAAAALLLAAYLGLPLALDEQVAASGTLGLATLRDRAERPGRYVEFDRETYVDRPDSDALRIFTGESIYLRGDHLDRTTTVSLQGRFAAPDTLRVTRLHEHRAAVRDGATYVGLLLLLAAWARWAYRRARRRAGSPQD